MLRAPEPQQVEWKVQMVDGKCQAAFGASMAAALQVWTEELEGEARRVWQAMGI